MKKNLKKRVYTSIALFVLLLLMLIDNYALGYFLMVIATYSILEFFQIIKLILEKNKIKQLFINLVFIFYIFAFCAFFLTLSFFLHLKILLFIILLTCVVSDIGGFVFGKIFKGPKLTKISPKKTISGAIGSIIFSSAFVFMSISYLTKNFYPYIFMTGCIISISCQIGDLFFSFLKRKASLKDTGNFLPGHGGFLDRIDGILLGVPIGFIILLITY
jgi:phosphatidate cytidylyltransferase